MLPYPFHLLLGALALGLSLVLTPLSARWGARRRIVDRPGGRRGHQGVVPRTGGVAIWLSFLLGLGAYLVLPRVTDVGAHPWFPVSRDPQEARRIWALLAGGLFCALWGLADDKWNLSPRFQYLVQFAAALIAMAGLVFIKDVNNPFQDGLLWGPDGFPWWLVFLVTVFWYMGCMNNVNFLDGLNGLAAGAVAILGLVLTVHMLAVLPEPQASVAVLPALLVGSVAGFWIINFARRSPFMGSSGSFFLGYAVASVGIMGGAKIATVTMVLGLPIVDVAWLIFSRLRRGQRPWHAGRDHLHYALLDRGVPERVIVAAYYAFCCGFGVLTLTLDDRLNKLLALIGLSVAALSVMAWLGRSYAPASKPGAAPPGA